MPPQIDRNALAEALHVSTCTYRMMPMTPACGCEGRALALRSTGVLDRIEVDAEQRGRESAAQALEEFGRGLLDAGLDNGMGSRYLHAAIIARNAGYVRNPGDATEVGDRSGVSATSVPGATGDSP